MAGLIRYGTADVVGADDQLVYLDDGVQSRKQIDEKKFDDMWSVMSYKKYKELEEAHTRKPSSEQSFRSYPGYVRWWEDEEEYLDLEK